MSLIKKFFTDRNKISDSKNVLKKYNAAGPIATDILITDHVTGEPICRRSNRIVTAGSLFTASKFFDIDAPHLPAYDSDAEGTSGSGILNIKNENGDYGMFSYPTDTEGKELLRRYEHCMFFAVGCEDHGIESSQIPDVDYVSRIEPVDIVPFITTDPDQAMEITQAEAALLTMPGVFTTTGTGESVSRINYGGMGRRKGTQDRAVSCFYFKKFNIDPVVYIRDVTSAEKTSLNEEALKLIYSNSANRNIEVCVELNFTLTKDECRNYFNLVEKDPAITTIMLVSAYETQDEKGNYYHKNIQPVTKLNISKESLEDATKGLDIVYHVYF